MALVVALRSRADELLRPSVVLPRLRDLDQMTPDKRATLLTAFKWIVATGLLISGLINAAIWFQAVAS
jgi:hypothetical protein